MTFIALVDIAHEPLTVLHHVIPFSTTAFHSIQEVLERSADTPVLGIFFTAITMVERGHVTVELVVVRTRHIHVETAEGMRYTNLWTQA